MVAAGRPSVRAIASVQLPFSRLSRMISFSLGVRGPNELTMGVTENLPAWGGARNLDLKVQAL